LHQTLKQRATDCSLSSSSSASISQAAYSLSDQTHLHNTCKTRHRPQLSINLQSISESEHRKESQLDHLNNTITMRSFHTPIPTTPLPVGVTNSIGTSAGTGTGTRSSSRVMTLPNFHEPMLVPSTPIPLVSKEAVTCASSLLSIDPAASILSPEILRKMKLALVRGAATIPLHNSKKRKEKEKDVHTDRTPTVASSSSNSHLATITECKELPTSQDLFSPFHAAPLSNSPNPTLSRDSSRGSIPELQTVHSNTSADEEKAHVTFGRKRSISPSSCASIEDVHSSATRRVRRKVLPLIPSLSALHVTSHGGDAHADEVLAAYYFARYLVDWSEQFTIIDKTERKEDQEVVHVTDDDEAETSSQPHRVSTTTALTDMTPTAMYFPATSPHANHSVQAHTQQAHLYPHSPQHHFETPEMARAALIAASSDVTDGNAHECEHIAASLIPTHQYIPADEMKEQEQVSSSTFPFSPMCFHLSALASPCALAASTAPAMSPPPFELEDGTTDAQIMQQMSIHFNSTEHHHNAFNIALHAFGKSR